MCVARDLISLEHGAVYGPIVKTAAAKHPVRTRAAESRTVGGNIPNVPCECVLARFPNVTRQIVNAELIGCLQRHWLGMIAMPAVIPRHGINIPATAEWEVVSPMRPPRAEYSHSVSEGRRNEAFSPA